MVVAEIFSAAMGTLIFGLVVVGMVLCIFGIVDAARRPVWAWQASGQNKSLWLVLNVVGVVFGLIFLGAVIIGPIYLLAIRPKVARAQSGGGPVGGDEYGDGQHGAPQ